MIHDRKAQSAVYGFLIFLVLLLAAAGLVDIYRLLEARSWAYQVAQEASLAGASRGRDWAYVATSGGQIRLDQTTAYDTAVQIVQAEMAHRGITAYSMDVRVLPDPGGGTIANYPPVPVRLGTALGDWTTGEPSVGVYLAVPVDWVMLDIFGIVGKGVNVFGSAGVAQ